MSRSGVGDASPARRSSSAPRWTPIAGALLLGSILLVPGAAAAPFLVSDALPVSGDLLVAAERAQIQDGMLLFSGALRLESTFEGPVLAMQTQDGTRIEADRIRVYDTDDPVSIARVLPHLEVTGGSLEPEREGSFYWSLPEATLKARAAHTFAFFFQLEANLPEMGTLMPERDGDAPPSLIAQAKRTPWSVTAPGEERSLFYPIEGGFQVRGPDGTLHAFDGDRWLVTLRGATTATLVANGVAVPFEEGHQARLAPPSGQAMFTARDLQGFLDVATGLADGFDAPKGLPEEGSDPCVEGPADCEEGDGSPDDTDGAGSNETGAPGSKEDGNGTARTTTTGSIQVPAAVVTAIDTLGPFLQGAFFGSVKGPLTVGDQDVANAGFTLVRYEALTLTSQSDGVVSYSGDAPFVYAGGAVIHDARTLRFGPLVISILSLAFYALAVGAWFLTRRWTFRPLDPALTERLRIPALVAQWGLLVVAFVLFDREIHYILGQSLLTSIGLYGGSATFALAGTAGILLVQLLFWSAAAVAFGVPIALLGRSGLKSGGLGRPTYGFAIGLGALATWLFGTALILAVLDVLFGSLAGALG